MGTGNATNFDQNEYFSFKLHRYHNIRDNNISLPKLDKFVDQVIPMVPCNNEKHDNDNGWDHSATLFCPEFKQTDIMKGDYYSEKSSWLRFIVHRCDPTDKVLIDGKV